MPAESHEPRDRANSSAAGSAAPGTGVVHPLDDLDVSASVTRDAALPLTAHGLSVPGYQILRELNRGGQGVVYQALQTSTQRKVAIKILLEGALASTAARRRFEREIDLVAHLKHPNIIAVFDSGETPDGHMFYVMDYVRGIPVTHYVRENKLSLEQSLNLFASICDAVNHAHQKGVIHRDLKPSNILIDIDGNLHILDFGLASRDQSLWVLGSNGSAELRHSFNFNVATPWTHGPNMVDDVAFCPGGCHVITACWDHLARFYSTASGDPSSLCTFKHQTSVHRVAFSLDGRLIATSQEGGLVRVWLSPCATTFPIAQFVRAQGYVQPRFTRDGRFAVAAGHSYRTRTITAAQVVESATAKPAGPLLNVGACSVDADFSPDGQRLAVAGAEPRLCEIRIWDWRNGITQAVIPTPSPPRSVLYSPDGRLLGVFCSGGQVLLARPDDATITHQMVHTPVAVPNNEYVSNGRVLFSPDGSTLLSWGGDERVRAWNVANGSPRFAPLAHQRKIYDASFSADGAYIASAAMDGTARVWNASTGEPVAAPLEHPDHVFRAHFSPDGKHLLTACRDGTANVWNWRARQRAYAPLQHASEVLDAAYTPDGRWIITTGYNCMMRLWDAGTGKPLAPAAITRGISTNVCVSGKFAGVGGNSGYLMLLNLGQIAQDEVEPIGNVRLLSELAAGKRIDNGQLVNLKPDEWLQRWRTMRSDGANRPQPPPADETLSCSIASTRSIATTQKAIPLKIPPRPANASPDMLDLTASYNGVLGGWQPWADCDLPIPPGVRKLGGVEFDVRGVVQLYGQTAFNRGGRFPVQALGLHVNRECRRLHFLHACDGSRSVRFGTPIASYVLHYTNGREWTIPVIYGQDIWDWWRWDNEGAVPETKDAVVAWTGANAAASRDNATLHVYRRSWDNPFPDQQIQSIDFVSQGTWAGPFLLAITLE